MKYTVVDAFVGEGALGNPAAVARMHAFGPDDGLRRLASESGQPATVFVQEVGRDEHHVRWFTPDESDFCGHGTLAAAHVLLPPGTRTTVKFRTRAGALTAWRLDRPDLVSLDLPALAVRPIDTPPGLADVLGADVVSTHDASGRLLVELEGEEAVRALEPDMVALRALVGQAVIVTARSSGPCAIVSRYFRAAGEAEDPVTGSAHCALSPFWAPRFGHSQQWAFQASSRGGLVHMLHAGDRVVISGRATTR